MLKRTLEFLYSPLVAWTGSIAPEIKYSCGPLRVAARAVMVVIVLVQCLPKCIILFICPAICDQFQEISWLHVCISYFEVYLRL